jgi:hypothetical protein
LNRVPLATDSGGFHALLAPPAHPGCSFT